MAGWDSLKKALHARDTAIAAKLNDADLKAHAEEIHRLRGELINSMLESQLASANAVRFVMSMLDGVEQQGKLDAALAHTIRIKLGIVRSALEDAHKKQRALWLG